MTQSHPFVLRCRRAILVAATLVVFVAQNAGHAQQQFGSPEDAVQALVNAARAANTKQLIAILGPDGRDIVSSGDPVADAQARKEFLVMYNTRHRIDAKDESSAVLLIGQIEWPFPVPIMRKNDVWSFDAAEGRTEILARRIGRNELDAIQACLAYVDAQNEYAERNPEKTGTYARRILSSFGKRDGLFWPKAEGEPVSPIGEAIVRASADGYRLGLSRTPYHGYYYAILTRQGRDAPGGVHDYLVNGKMIGGFGLVAYPAEYRNSGVMTFIVNHAGKVFQKDLGLRTAQIAGEMKSFNPDQSWQVVDITPASP